MSQPISPPSRLRIRQALPNLPLGKWRPGTLNSLTDVPGVLVHTQSIHRLSSTIPTLNNPSINTGVTTILPRADWSQYCSFAGVFSFNGAGEMTGTHWINETGLLTTPIILTTTCAIGDAYRGIWEYTFRNHTNEDGEVELFIFPVVAETYDGFLNDQGKFAITPEHIVQGIENASAEAVPEGNTGGGTGMICHRFKGGTGSSSRVVAGFDVQGNPVSYTVGVLVQANYGVAENLHIGGIPIGSILKAEQTATSNSTPSAETPTTKLQEPRKDGSIIAVIATDAPLLPVQLQRLAKRATVGLAKVGGYGANSSGDIFLAFSTASKIPFQELSYAAGRPVSPYCPQPLPVQMALNESIDGLFEAAADATEEAIYNAMFMAKTMTGFLGRKVEALDVQKIKHIVAQRMLSPYG